jgi:hypothetical protein
VQRFGPLGFFGLIGAFALTLGAGVCLAQPAPERSPAGVLRTGFDEFTPPGKRRFVRTKRQRNLARRDRTFGNPPGSGAGKTGFISTNAPEPAGERPPAGTPLLPSDILNAPPTSGGTSARPVGLSAAPEARAAAGRPASPRPGATLEPALPAPTWPVEDDPFAPTGFRAGSFIVRPAIEAGGGYDSNPGRASGGRGSWFYRVAPELQAHSDWSRHELTAALRGSYIGYEAVPSANQPSLDARLNGRIDFTRNTWANLEGRLLVATDNPNSPDLPAGLSRLPIYTTLGATGGLTHRFNRLEFTVRGTLDHVTYENSHLTNGATDSNRDRNYDQYGALARVAYELTPGIKPFAEAAFDRRVHELSVDRFGLRRDSDGVTGRVGTTFEVSRKLTGEISIGYLTRTYKDPTLPDLDGLIFDGSLVWAATGLTTVKLTATSTADESTLPGVSGVLRRDGGVQVDHAFRRWLIGTAKLGYGVDLYRGSPREDQRYLASFALTYKLTRDMQLKGEVRREWLRSNVTGSDFDANIALLSLRLQR